MANPPQTPTVAGWRAVPLVLLRIAIGWHFLYEGVYKILAPEWSAKDYLLGAVGPFADFYHGLAANNTILAVVDSLNIWGLVLIGIGLMFGALSRFSALCGMALLALYYFAYPPFFTDVPVGGGHYIVVNQVFVEFLALGVIFVFPVKSFGADAILGPLMPWNWKRSKAGRDSVPTHGEAVATSMVLSRRKALAGLVGVPFVGAFVLAVLKKRGYESIERRQIAEAARLGGPAPVDGLSGATVHRFEWTNIEELKKKPPMAKIKDLELSRVLLGGNLIGGWAHARDLIYVDKLVKAYHNEKKIFETFQLAEECGVNAIITNPILCEAMESYWRNTGGKMKFISDCGGSNMLEMAQKSIDSGAVACYVHGGVADTWAKDGKFDEFAKVIELIRENGIPAGIGGHQLETVKGCVEAGLDPDFWMKTLHKTDYWSATEVREHDNIWSETPEETIAFMESLPQPWIAFKTMAAGAIQPREAFSYAFSGGADFICVGMYDFQIVEDVNMAMEVLDNVKDRKRPWRAETIEIA